MFTRILTIFELGMDYLTVFSGCSHLVWHFMETTESTGRRWLYHLQRVRLASFYCAFDKLGIAKSLLAPVINDPRLDAKERKLFITLQFHAYQDQHEFIDYLINQYPILGRQQWCSMWTEGRYLSYLLLEDLKLKKFYNCQCVK